MKEAGNGWVAMHNIGQVTTLGLAPATKASETHGQAKVKNHLRQAPEECVFETGRISKSQGYLVFRQ